MATKIMKGVMTFGIIVAAVFIGMTFVVSDDVYAGTSSSVVIVRPGFDDRFVAPRPFVRPIFNPFLFSRFNPFLFDDDIFFGAEEEDFFFDREDFFEREERDDD